MEVDLESRRTVEVTKKEMVHTIGLIRQFQCPGGSLLVTKQAAAERDGSTQEELETVYLR